MIECPICEVKFDKAKRGKVCPNGHPIPDQPTLDISTEEPDDIATRRCNNCGNVALNPNEQVCQTCEDGDLEPAGIEDLRESTLIDAITGESVGRVDLGRQFDTVSSMPAPAAAVIHLRAAAIHRPAELITYRDRIDSLVDKDTRIGDSGGICSNCGEPVEFTEQFCPNCGSQTERPSGSQLFNEGALLLGYLSGEDSTCVDQLESLLEGATLTDGIRRALHIAALRNLDRTSDLAPTITSVVADREGMVHEWSALLVLLATADETAERAATDLAFEFGLESGSTDLLSLLDGIDRDPELAASRARSAVKRVAAGTDRGPLQDEDEAEPAELPAIFAGEGQPLGIATDAVNLEQTAQAYPVLVGALVPDIIDATANGERIPHSVAGALAAVADETPSGVEPAVDWLIQSVQTAESEQDARPAACALSRFAREEFERSAPALYDYLTLVAADDSTVTIDIKQTYSEAVNDVLQAIIGAQVNEETAQQLSDRGYFRSETVDISTDPVIDDRFLT